MLGRVGFIDGPEMPTLTARKLDGQPLLKATGALLLPLMPDRCPQSPMTTTEAWPPYLSIRIGLSFLGPLLPLLLLLLALLLVLATEYVVDYMIECALFCLLGLKLEL